MLTLGLVLEEIYKTTDFGPFAAVPQSLFNSGKSRADLWAFAGLVAVKRTVENSNNKCDSTKPAPCILQVFYIY